MYSFVHQTPRLKTNYDSSNSRYNPYHSNLDMASSSKQPEAAPRRNRYQRSSTISVTQLLTDSCSSLLQRLTTRVRGPSQVTNVDHQPSTSSTVPLTHNVESSFLGTTRSRLEDKYSSVLEKLAGKRRDPERTLEPSVSKTIEKRANPLMKSATTASIPAKVFPTSLTREKTPYRTSTTRISQHKNFYPEPPYAYLDHYSAYNVRQKSGNINDLRPRRSAKPMRTGKSETGEKIKNNFKLCPVEIPSYSFEEKDKTPTNEEYTDPQIVEREARRKEIQSLIMKYSALDEAYNKATNNNAITINQGNKAPEPPPHGIKHSHKYQPISLGPAVSKISSRNASFNNLFVSCLIVVLFTNNQVFLPLILLLIHKLFSESSRKYVKHLSSYYRFYMKSN